MIECRQSLEVPLQQRTVSETHTKLAMGQAGELSCDVGAQCHHAEVRKPLKILRARADEGACVIDKRKSDELLLDPRYGENLVDAFVDGTLFPVFGGTVNIRKCWTKGWLVGNNVHGSRLD